MLVRQVVRGGRSCIAVTCRGTAGQYLAAALNSGAGSPNLDHMGSDQRHWYIRQRVDLPDSRLSESWKGKGLLRRSSIRMMIVPLIATVSIVILAVLWVGGRKPGVDLLASFMNATLFLAIGIIIREIDFYRSPYRNFRKLFKGIEIKANSDRHESFYVVLPHFRINPEVQSQIEVALDRMDGADKRVFNLYRNPSVFKYMPNHKVTLEVALASNDSEAGILLASAIGRMTQGSFTPIFKTDEGGSVDLDKPAVLLGLYSNAWVHAYWEHERRSQGVLRPLDDQVGFWVRADGKHYKRYLPLGNDDQELADFWTKDSPDISTDYAIVARVRGNSAPNAVWFLCAGIGKAATHGAAQYLSRDSILQQIIEDFSGVPEFALVLQVSARNLADVREVHCWPPGMRSVENDPVKHLLLEASAVGTSVSRSTVVNQGAVSIPPPRTLRRKNAR